ncbi:MAG: BatA domain-containing protein [Isosphaeraceae bacterium]
MSALTPLYLLGMLAVAAPIVFHLIRRRPKGEMPFSSLIFLTPSPPKLTRRSRLDHLLLLLLRASVLCLLAVAFARPFLRQEAQWNLGEETQRRIAVLVDTSASLRRGDLWRKARSIAEQVISDCGPTDEFAVFAFDTATHPVLGFREASTLDHARRQAVARARLDGLEPTWKATNLGQALVDAVGAIEDVADASEKTGRMPRRIVLISDLQQGSRLEALGEFEWPKDVELDIKTVSDDTSNAGLHRLADAAEAVASGADRDRRVRVFNDPGSRRENFALQWTGEKGNAIGDPIEVYVPPGESRVVRVPRPEVSASPMSLVLKGDTAAFDNTLYVADEKKEEANVLFVGDDRPDDPAGLLYYVMRVFPETSRRSVKVQPRPPRSPLSWESDRTLPLVILDAETTPENARRLKAYVEGGGTLLDVVSGAGQADTLATLAGTSPRSIAEAGPPPDVLLSEIAFDHPLFAPLAGAQYSDFTKIHFWKHRKFDPEAIGGARVLARFENGHPAVLEKTIGKGSLVIMTSSWKPADSQLARSSKFVAMMAALLDRRDPHPFDAEDHTVGDRVALPASIDAAEATVVHRPAGPDVAMAADSTSFADTDEPGVYTINPTSRPRVFVVNLDPAESKTSPMAVETLEQFGCRLVNPTRTRIDRDLLRQMRNAELESRQKLWRWLILAAIGVLIVETLLAGRIKRPRPAHAEALST